MEDFDDDFLDDEDDVDDFDDEGELDMELLGEFEDEKPTKRPMLRAKEKIHKLRLTEEYLETLLSEAAAVKRSLVKSEKEVQRMTQGMKEAHKGKGKPKSKPRDKVKTKKQAKKQDSRHEAGHAHEHQASSADHELPLAEEATQRKKRAEAAEALEEEMPPPAKEGQRRSSRVVEEEPEAPEEVPSPAKEATQHKKRPAEPHLAEHPVSNGTAIVPSPQLDHGQPKPILLQTPHAESGESEARVAGSIALVGGVLCVIGFFAWHRKLVGSRASAGLAAPRTESMQPDVPRVKIS